MNELKAILLKSLKMHAIIADKVKELEIKIIELENHPRKECTCTKCTG